MNLQSPIRLKNKPFPECINFCMCPDFCKTHCEDKIKKYHSMALTFAILIFFLFGSGIYLLISSFKIG